MTSSLRRGLKKLTHDTVLAGKLQDLYTFLDAPVEMNLEDELEDEPAAAVMVRILLAWRKLLCYSYQTDPWKARAGSERYGSLVLFSCAVPLPPRFNCRLSTLRLAKDVRLRAFLTIRAQHATRSTKPQPGHSVPPAVTNRSVYFL